MAEIIEKRGKSFIQLLEESLPDKTDPNYEFFKNYALGGVERGERIWNILGHFTSLEGKKVLDLGCGNGGTGIYFAKNGLEVVALDIDHGHTKRSLIRANEHGVRLLVQVASAEKTGLISYYFDLVITQDLIEHVSSVEGVAREVSRVLKNDGYIYLTAPNRFSPLNVIADPHHRLFGIVLLPKRLADAYLNIRNRKGYKVEHYPSLGCLKNVFHSYGIELRQFDLLHKIDNPSLIGSPYLRKMAAFLHDRKIIFLLKKIGLLNILVNIYGHFISQGWIFIGRKTR